MTPGGRIALVTTVWGSIVLLYVPLLTVAVASFNSTRYGMTWESFSLRWYQEALGDPAMLAATWRTLLLATVSTMVSTVLGTAIAIGLARCPWSRPARSLVETVTHLPLVTPDIMLAAALIVAFSLLQSVSDFFSLGFLTMCIAHVTFQIGFVTIVVAARLAAIDWPVQAEAARDLGAHGWTITRRILLPQLLPGIIGGAVLAFTLSLDDFIISFFTKGGPDSTTLPIHIYASLRKGLHPSLRAISTLLFILTVILVIAAIPFTARRARA